SGGAFPAELDTAFVTEALLRRGGELKPGAERTRVLDLLFSLPIPRFADGLTDLALTEAEEDRAALVLCLRFGAVRSGGWAGWRGWLLEQAAIDRVRRTTLLRAVEGDPVMLLLWYRGQPDRNRETEARLRARCPQACSAGEFTARWADRLSREEWLALEPEAVRLPASPPPLPPVETTAEAEAEVLENEPDAVESVPDRPSFWRAHVRPVVNENWYVFAGIAMVIVGASLLAFYTWNKAWWLRYTIMPGLLAGFTWGLARLAGWMEGRSGEFRDTGAILRGAAIGLLPLNFMVVALLSHDRDVPGRGFMALLLGSVYLLVFGVCLLRWCREVHASLRVLLGCPLLLVGGLVAAIPLIVVTGNGAEGGRWIVVGFYLGFAVVAAAAIRFARRISAELASDGRVPWFFGATLAGTYLQSFAWVHGYLRFMPDVLHYAPLSIFAGWLVLFVERRHLELFPLKAGARLGTESFLGYAFVILGLLMGAGDPWMRMVIFALAGLVWLYQARAREEALHHWIGLMLLVLAGASAGLLPGFPKEWLAGLGVGMALMLGVARRVARGRGEGDFAEACAGIQTSALVISTVIAVLAQWHYRSAPLATAGWLTGIATILVVAAAKENRLAWVHTAAAILALTLPYLGCVDLEERTLHGNTMVFGLACLSVLWIAANWMVRHPLMRDARSTVLWLYGALATTGMIVRVLLEGGKPFDPLWYYDFMDYTGPLLIAVALVFATVYSRSLIPSFMAIVIGVILFPELNANLRGSFVSLVWGTGLGSAASALALVLGCFWLRSWERLRRLPEGDRFFGRELFPLRRHDHTLFTWPMLVAAVVLALRVDTWILVENLWRGSAGMRTALALCLSGVVWAALGIYQRHDSRAKAGAVAGAIWVFAGLELFNRNLAEPLHPLWAMMVTAFVLQIAILTGRRQSRSGREWVNEVFVTPMNGCSRVLSLCAAAMLILLLWSGGDRGDIRVPLIAFTGLLIWHGRESGKSVFGYGLYGLVLVGVLDQLRPTGLRAAVLWVNAAFMILHAGGTVGVRRAFQALLSPTMICAGGVTLAVGLSALFGFVVDGADALVGVWLPLFVAVSVAAWVNASGPFALLAMLLAYVFVLRGADGAALERLAILLEPWRMAVFSVVMIASYQGGRWCLERLPLRVRPGFNRHPLFSHSPADWIQWAATAIAAAATLRHSMDADLRQGILQTLTPYFAAVALGWTGWLRRHGWFYVCAAGFLLLGNHHLVRWLCGDAMRSAGLTGIHQFCLGLGMSLAQIVIARRYVTMDRGAAALNGAGMWLGGGILSVLAANYFTEANLATITEWRFAFSGTLALLTGWYFREVASTPKAGEVRHIARSFYHFGVTMALWCAALLIPWLRNPVFVMIPLALPVFYFYLRAEMESDFESTARVGYRTTATLMGFLMLALYAGRGLFQMVLFPGEAIEVSHHHINAPLLLFVSVILLRLRGLGGTSWAAFYGGLGLMVGSFFLVTWLPAWSPFHHPIAAAWCAVFLSHFWITTSVRPSPLKTLAQRIARLDESDWVEMRRAWGLALSGCVHLAWFAALGEVNEQPRLMAPLLVGVASVMVHQGLVRRSVAFFALGGMEVLAALHAGFVVPSYLAAGSVVWVLLGIWAGLLVFSRIWSARLPARLMGFVVAGFSALGMLHTVYHRPWSVTGLWVVLIGAVFVALNPRSDSRPSSLDERLAAWGLALVPTWLVFFWWMRSEGHGAFDPLNTNSLLAGALTLFLTGTFAGWIQARETTSAGSGICCFHQMLDEMRRHGSRMRVITAAGATLLAGVIQLLNYGRAFTAGELTLMLILYGGLSWSWFRETRSSNSRWFSYAAQFCAAAFFIVIRRQLMLTTGLWNYEYDVWAALAVSFCLAGAKQHWDHRENTTRVPMIVAMFVLPAVACAWVLLHHLGTDVALLVVGLYSLQFTFMGRDNRESPYNVVATFGFVAFVLISFWGKLEVRYLHAFLIPVGVGVLVLLQLFGRRLAVELKNRVRLMTLITMIGSAGYYALTDDRHTLGFNLIVIALCLAAMGFGSLLRIRLYLAIGFAGLVVDLIAILYRVMIRLDDGALMSSAGLFILVAGVALVGGAVFYKTHAQTLSARLNAWRGAVRGWE
ncbi:MAG: hypothetical protein ISQ14_03805, partial [Verrucomicrobiae bacterium]|nr:hypothetical protein [Verrucomicrobiae bacterium]